MSQSPIDIVEANPEHASGLAELFQRTGCPCHCRYWHFQGTNNEWLDRCANHPEENRSELRSALQSRSDEARGLVALSGSDVVGWMKLAPAPAVQKLYDKKLYRGLPCFDGDRTGVFTIGCFLIDEDYRRCGLTRRLVERAIEIAPGWGAVAIEAFPRRGDVPVEQLWTGPANVLMECGFEEIYAFEPYPVLRRRL